MRVCFIMHCWRACMRQAFVNTMVAGVALCVASSAVATPAGSYSEADFARAPKFDVHVHDNVARDALLDIAGKDNFELLSINVDSPDFPPLPLQARAALAHRAEDANRFHFATAFSMAGFGQP